MNENKKTALITGASSGIGRDIARELAFKNYDLILIGRNEEKLKNLKSELEKNTNVKTYSIDLSIKENVYNLFEQVKDIDLLINNAGFGDYGKFTKTDLSKEISMIETNIIALHILTKLYMQAMVKKDYGQILNVASVAGFMPGPLMATYYASKNYVVALTRAIHKELKKEKSNVKISVLCPGPVNTNFNNVANVKFKIDGLSSEYVAKYTVNKLLKNKFMIIPGKMIKLLRAFSEITPDVIKEEVSYFGQTQTKKEYNKK